jgi:hypothetical protein
MGAFTSDYIWHDDDPDQIETLPDDALHRDIELLVINADKQGKSVLARKAMSLKLKVSQDTSSPTSSVPRRSGATRPTKSPRLALPAATLSKSRSSSAPPSLVETVAFSIKA